MKAVKVLSILLLISSAFAADSNEISNDIAEDDGRSLNPTMDYDPSFLDEILGPDYFDDSNKAKETTTEAVVAATDAPEPEVVSKRGPCMGCPTDVSESNLKDQKLQDLASYAVEAFESSYDGEKNEDESLQIIRIIKAQTQVVAGYKYIMKLEAGFYNCSKEKLKSNPEECALNPSRPRFECDFELIEQSWVGRKEVLSSNCVESQYQEVSVDDDYEEGQTTTGRYMDYVMEDEDGSKRRKRDTNAVGKIRQADENEEELKDIAKYAIEQLDTIDEDNEARFLVDVLNVRKQTVAGWLYHMKLRVAMTGCLEGKNATLEQCQDKLQLPFRICDVKVLFQPWQTVQKKVTESQCVPEKMKASKKLARKLFGDEFKKKSKKIKKDKSSPKLIGAPVEVDPESPELASLMDWAMNSIDQQSNALHVQKLVKVHHADRQIVNGIMNHVTIETGYTKCRKNAITDTERSACELDESKEHNFCEMKIWDKPWLHEKRVTYSKCGKKEEILKRKKRSLIGGGDHDYLAHDIAKFEEFRKEHGKEYSTHEEYKYRLGVFKDNMKKVKLLQENEQGTATYGATQFADLTEEEFSTRYLGLRPDLRQKSRTKMAKIPPFTKLPDEFDWRHYNAVTPVKNQGMCGSCWAFSVTGNIEGLYARKHKTLLSFSEQELVDCDTLDSGCGGGLPENAYKSLQKLGGLETEQAYPYDGKNEKCSFKTDLAKAQVTGFVEVPKNETQMAAWLMKNGPISIGINANAMQFYYGGVSHPWKFLCNPKQLDHGVLIVGYGVHTTSIRHKTMPYWVVKNSWGPHWGEQGYYRVYRGDGTCGLNQMATSAVIA